MSSPSRQSGARRAAFVDQGGSRVFRVSEKTVRRWIAAGVLVAHKLGRQWRIAPDEIERFLLTRASWQRRYVS